MEVLSENLLEEKLLSRPTLSPLESGAGLTSGSSSSTSSIVTFCNLHKTFHLKVQLMLDDLCVIILAKLNTMTKGD